MAAAVASAAALLPGGYARTRSERQVSRREKVRGRRALVPREGDVVHTCAPNFIARDATAANLPQGPLRLLDARPTASQGLRVVDASCAPNFTTTVDGRAAACANSTDCVSFGFLSVGKFEPHMGPCETYFFSEQYNLTVDDEPWQYWMKKETPGSRSRSRSRRRRAVVPLLRAPTGNVTVSGSGR